MAQQRSEPEVLKILAGILMTETFLAVKKEEREKGKPEEFCALHHRLEKCDVFQKLARTYPREEQEDLRLRILFALWLLPRVDKLSRTRSSLTDATRLQAWIAQQQASGTADPKFLAWCSQICDAAMIVLGNRQHGRRGRQTQIPRLDSLWLAALVNELKLRRIRPVYNSLADLLRATSPQKDEEANHPRRPGNRVRYVRQHCGEREDEQGNLPRRLGDRVRYVRKHFSEMVDIWYEAWCSRETLTLFKRVELKILKYKQD